MIRPFVLGTLVGVLLLAGCSSKTSLPAGACGADTDCGDPAFFRCDTAKGACLCRADAACGPGERCNTSGYCQVPGGCFENLDCPDGLFCDVASNTCISKGSCASDAHCPVGTLCLEDSVTLNRRCVAGCRSSGDCVEGNVCACPVDDGNGGTRDEKCECEGADGERKDCAVGVCKPGCDNSDDCPNFGERCVPGDGAPWPMTCKNDISDERPYCRGCVSTESRVECGNTPSFCLVNGYDNVSSCGADCSRGQECAKGFQCRSIRLVWSNTRCTTPSQCRKPALGCSVDEDCPIGGTCVEGACQAECRKSEGGSYSYCSCMTASDCPQDTCDPARGICQHTKVPCSPEQPCKPIECRDGGGVGYCFIGANCTPVEGLTCTDLFGGQ